MEQDKQIRNALIELVKDIINNPLFPQIEDVEMFVDDHLKKSNKRILNELDKIKPNINKIRSQAVAKRATLQNELHKTNEVINWCDKQ